MDFDADAKLNQIGARLTVNSKDKNPANEEFINRMMFERIHAQLASLLSRDAIRITENVYSTDYEVRLYVLTADQLEKYVQRRAERMGGYQPQIIEQSYVAIDQR